MSRKKYYKIQPQKYQCLTIVIPKNHTSLQMTDLQHSYKPINSSSIDMDEHLKTLKVVSSYVLRMKGNVIMLLLE